VVKEDVFLFLFLILHWCTQFGQNEQFLLILITKENGENFIS